MFQTLFMQLIVTYRMVLYKTKLSAPSTAVFVIPSIW